MTRHFHDQGIKCAENMSPKSRIVTIIGEKKPQTGQYAIINAIYEATLRAVAEGTILGQ
jgi:hypothetical protein